MAMMFAVFCFGGVEAAAIYSEEARNPRAHGGSGHLRRRPRGGRLLPAHLVVPDHGRRVRDVQHTALENPGGFGFIMIGQVLGSSAAVS